MLKIFYTQRNIITAFIIDRDKFSRPKFISLEENNGIPYLELIDCVHPCLLDRVPYFVPNNIYLGKDTIKAQIGCFVPAKKCVMTLFDRIFTLIGANGRLLEGKSTYLYRNRRY